MRPTDEQSPHEAPRAIIDLITGAWRTQALYTAAALRLADHVAAGVRTVDELARVTGSDTDGLHRLMRLLVALAVFDEDENGYCTTPIGEVLRSDIPGSMREMCLLYGAEFYDSWRYAHASITASTDAFERAVGQPLGQYLGDHRAAAERFHAAMGSGQVFLEQVPQVLDFTACDVVIDVGGGRGQLLAGILAAAPQATGVLVDLGTSLDLGGEFLSRSIGLDRVDLVDADIFTAIPSGGDVYLLSRVLQDWDDNACVRLLQTCRQAMANRSRLVVIDRVIRPDVSRVLPALWDVHMKLVSGGRERTLDGYQALFANASLELERTIDLALENTVLVATPM